jgi:hypothetical protein
VLQQAIPKDAVISRVAADGLLPTTLPGSHTAHYGSGFDGTGADLHQTTPGSRGRHDLHLYEVVSTIQTFDPVDSEWPMKTDAVFDKAGDASNPPQATAAGLSRRALLRAGAGASPVLLTLASAPVAANPFANNGTCTLASSFVSVATFKSRNPTATSLSCASRNADHWRNLATTAPTTPALNVSVATLLGSTTSSFNSMLVKDVLLAPLPTTGSVQTVGELGTVQHLIAMALNLNAGFMTAGAGFDLGYVQSVWSNYKSNGNRYKKPGSQIDWGDAEIIAWARMLLGYVLL